MPAVRIGRESVAIGFYLVEPIILSKLPSFRVGPSNPREKVRGLLERVGGDQRSTIHQHESFKLDKKAERLAVIAVEVPGRFALLSPSSVVC